MINYTYDLSSQYIQKETLYPLSECLKYAEASQSNVKGMGIVIISLLVLLGFLLWERIRDNRKKKKRLVKSL